MIARRPIGWLLFGGVFGVLIGSSANRLIYGYWLWQRSIAAFVVVTIITLAILMGLWWIIWRPRNGNA